MKKITSVLAMVALLTGLSCQKGMDPAQSQSDGELLTTHSADRSAAEIQVVDGRLKFASRADFDKTVQMLAQQQDRLGEFEQQFLGFVSVRTAFSRMTDQDNVNIIQQGLTEGYKGYVSIIDSGEDKEIVRSLTDPILATLISQDGWVYIGTDAYYVNRNTFQIVRNQSAEKIAAVMAGKPQTTGVVMGKVSHQPATSKGARASGSETCIREYFNGSNKRRMAGDVDYTFYDGAALGTFYESLTIYTKHQRRNLGVYWTELATNRLDLSGSIQVNTLSFGSRIEQYSTGSSNVSNVSKSYPASCSDIPGQGRLCNQWYNQVRTQHSGISTTNSYLSCSVTGLF